MILSASGEVALGLGIIAASAYGFARLFTQEVRRVHTESLHEIRSISERAMTVLTVREGMNPYAADPTKYGPTGLTREDERKQAAATAPPNIAQERSEEERDLQEAEEHYFATLAARANMTTADLDGNGRERPEYPA